MSLKRQYSWVQVKSISWWFQVLSAKCFRYIGAYEEDPIPGNVTLPPGTPFKHNHHGQDSATGILFASKVSISITCSSPCQFNFSPVSRAYLLYIYCYFQAIVQLMINPFSGALIDRIGYDIPMMIGLCIMFLSTAVFACGRSYSLLFFARSLQVSPMILFQMLLRIIRQLKSNYSIYFESTTKDNVFLILDLTQSCIF